MSRTITALDIARSLIEAKPPLRETSGRNRSEIIDRINRSAGLPLGSPYCAAGVSYCFREAAAANGNVYRLASQRFPYSGGSQAIRAAFKRRGKLFSDPQRLSQCRGALGGWTQEGGERGHVFLIGERLVSGGLIVALGTWEFNTSPVTKERDGEGAYHLRRRLSELRYEHPDFWFCDTTGLCGGEWW